MAARVPVRLTEDMPVPAQVGDALTVTVTEAEAGSGMVSIAPMASVAAGSEGNEITVTYTAIGEIGEGKEDHGYRSRRLVTAAKRCSSR